MKNFLMGLNIWTVLGILGALCLIGIFLWQENNLIGLTQREFVSSDLPQGFDGYRDVYKRQDLSYQRNVCENHGVFIPAGTWHNLINTGHKPIKLYSIYAPPQHPKGTVHETKAAADAAEHVSLSGKTP